MAIPVLDLSPLLCRITHPSNQANPPTASQIQEEQHEVNTTLSSLRAACEDKGIFILTNHHIPCSLQDRALEQSKRFFALPMEEKKRLGEEKSWGRSCRGYQAFGGEAYEEGQVPDFKEGFQIGIHKALDHPDTVAKRMLTGPNVFPAALEPEFSSTMLEYFEAVGALSLRLVEILAECLGVDHGTHFGQFVRDPLQALRLLHYPPTGDRSEETKEVVVGEKKRLGTGAHTDFGLVTLLLTDGVAGLQVFDEEEDKWTGVGCAKGDYIVNLGDIFTKLTGGIYKSPLHRVLNEGSVHRYSIPCFLDGNLDAVVNSFIDGPKVERNDMTVEEHMTERFKTTRERAKEEMKRADSGTRVVGET